MSTRPFLHPWMPWTRALSHCAPSDAQGVDDAIRFVEAVAA
jgi:hypothetical protein